MPRLGTFHTLPPTSAPVSVQSRLWPAPQIQPHILESGCRREQSPSEAAASPTPTLLNCALSSPHLRRFNTPGGWEKPSFEGREAPAERQTSRGNSPLWWGRGSSAAFVFQRPASTPRGWVCVRTFPGAFFVPCFALSHLSRAKMCPWVVPKANRLWAGHSRQPDGAFALMAWGRWLPSAWTPLWAQGR